MSINICFLSGDMSKSGGTERVTSIIANELYKKEKEFSIHILSIQNSTSSSFFEINPNIKHDTILVKENVSFKRDYFNVVKGIRRYIRENKIDILIDVDVINDIFSIPAISCTNTKLISWEHFNYHENNGTKLRSISRKLAAKYSNFIVTLTEQDRKNYEKNLKVSNKIKCIYNPIEKVVNETCDINAKQLISVGRLTYQKGFDMLCEVAKDVLYKHREWKWVILGEGEDRRLLENKIEEYGLQERLLLKGNVSNIDEYYKNSSIFVMTSRYEGLPMTLLEAKGYSMPIVSFNCLTGPSDIITDGVNGLLIEPNNIEEMTLKIVDLIKKEDKIEALSINAKNDINKYDLDVILDIWRDLLIKL